MSQINNPLEIFKLLPKSNCRQCSLPTCLAFAAAVINGQKRLKECPHLESSIIKQFDGKVVKPVDIEQQQEQVLEGLKKQIADLDLSSSADKLGGTFSGGNLTI